MNAWREEPVVFECAGERVIGILHLGSRADARLGVLVVVGGPQYRVGSHRQFVLMARDLAVAGYPVLRFDYRGMGDAEGAQRCFEQIEEDIRAALAAFRRALPALERVVLWGLCDAASAILMLNPAPPEVAGRVLVNPWARTEAGAAHAYIRYYYLRRLVQRSFWRKLFSGGLDLRTALLKFSETLTRSFSPRVGNSVASSFIDRMLNGARSCAVPCLLLISGRDLVAREFEHMRENSSDWGKFLSRSLVRSQRFARADHTFSERTHLDEATRTTMQWIAGIHLTRS